MEKTVVAAFDTVAYNDHDELVVLPAGAYHVVGVDDDYVMVVDVQGSLLNVDTGKGGVELVDLDLVYAQHGLRRIRQQVQVRDDVDSVRPAPGETGLIVSFPDTGSDWFDHPLVWWDSDLVHRHVPSSWLIPLD